ncbi:MAG: hypothetical protein AAB660_02570 [Patescibacteria group bacterium]
MIKIFDKNGYANRGRFLGWGSGPDADWKVIFSVLILLLLATAIFSTIVFLNVGNGAFGSDVTSTTESPLDKKLLQNNVKYYKNKQSVFESLRVGKETTPDPSV